MKRVFLWAILLSVIAGILTAFMLSLSKHEPVVSVTSVTLRQAQHERTTPGTPLILSSSKDERITTPSFTLTDQEGWSFDSESLRGRVWIADFIFTSCAGSCPRMSEQMALLQKRLPAEIQLVSVTVDPKRDSPEALAEYARRYGARGDRWHFLTGPADDIAKIVQQGFRLSYAEGGGPEEPVTHSSRFVLVDRSGAIRGYYDSNEPAQFEQLVKDARTLAK